MTPENFCYWLNGMFELSETDRLSASQTEVIKHHLDLVFNKVTPEIKIEDNKPELVLDDMTAERIREILGGANFNPTQYQPVNIEETVDPLRIDAETQSKPFCSNLSDEMKKGSITARFLSGDDMYGVPSDDNDLKVKEDWYDVKFPG